MEDVDHRLLPLPPPPMPLPPTTSANRHPVVPQDVDHRNLISLTHQPPRLPAPRAVPPPINLDQDYRVPPMVAPTDIVESVDMDLSEDEDQQGMYPNQSSATEHRRHSFNNNKVLVGGDNGKTEHHNLIRINSSDFEERKEKEQPHSAPVIPRMLNPFDNMPPDLKSFNLPFQKNFSEENIQEDAYDEDLRSRGIKNPMPLERNPSPPDYEEFPEDWNNRGPRFVNQRFPRNWGPRTNMRPGFPPQQFWPRNGPRPPNRWMGPRPQRFW
ncbi:hypothetical protein MSG28_012766 [Choristoneura fumiferana]|uniref:Uncharacterized protein n=2 Tax=Choristoneura fumiferana TaxID=7141 RepID=A0ACC0JHY8_CHOFU|nr:hypothetical protein MSG28_012766 [Choristoneura fumiferana]